MTNIIDWKRIDRETTAHEVAGNRWEECTSEHNYAADMKDDILLHAYASAVRGRGLSTLRGGTEATSQAIGQWIDAMGREIARRGLTAEAEDVLYGLDHGDTRSLARPVWAALIVSLLAMDALLIWALIKVVS